MFHRFLCSECVDEMRNLGFLVRAGASDIRVRFVPLLVLRLWINSRKSAQINLCNKFLSCSWFKRVESKMTAMKKTDFLFSSSWKEPCHAFVCFQPVVGQDGSLTRLNRGLFVCCPINTNVLIKCVGWWQQFRISFGPLSKINIFLR